MLITFGIVGGIFLLLFIVCLKARMSGMSLPKRMAYHKLVDAYKEKHGQCTEEENKVILRQAFFMPDKLANYLAGNDAMVDEIILNIEREIEKEQTQ